MAMKSTATARKPKVPASLGYCVYIGPSIRGVVQFGSIHKGSLEAVQKKLASGIEKFPLIAALIVPGEALPEARVRVKTPGTALHDINHRLVKSITSRKI